MEKVIGVRFRTAGKIYYFSPGKLNIPRGKHVIVETARGVEYGSVVVGTKEVEDKKVVQPLKPVIRIATAEDDAREAANRQKEKEAFRICQEKIKKHGLEMKLIQAEYTFDNNKVLFYLRRTDGSISGSWLRIWPVCSVRELSCVRSESGMRRRFWEASASAEEACAVIRIFPSLCRFPSRWRRSRTCP